MSKRRKSWKEKLLDDKDLPRVITIEGKLSKRWGKGTCVIPAPREVDGLMRRVRRGKLTTINHIRKALAVRHGATIACPITTGIFRSHSRRSSGRGPSCRQETYYPVLAHAERGGRTEPVSIPAGPRGPEDEARRGGSHRDTEGHKIHCRGG